MKMIRLAYSPLINAGDALNVDLVEMLSGKKVVRSKVYNADMMAIGGALFGAQYSDGLRGVAQKGMHILYGGKPLYIWGSGFLKANSEKPFYRDNLIVCALRGEKTQKKLSKIMRKEYDVVLADAGLLVDKLLNETIEKKYRMGVIPHFSQQNETIFNKAKGNDEILYIDIRKPPRVVVKEIASCETIASSSLHGLIFADSLHIPSLHLIGNTDLPGGNFKFQDYYSSYGLQDIPWPSFDALPTERDILERCRIDYQMVEKKKEDLIKCFPKF